MAVGPGVFRTISEGHYRMAFADLGVEFVVDRVRRDRSQELHGELSVSCGMLGTRAIDGLLSVGGFNITSTRARQEKAKYLAERARTNGKVDWLGMLEDVCQAILAAERQGAEVIHLRSLPKPVPEQEFDVLGVRFPKHHPTIAFGDGGTMKSYFALLVAGELTKQGTRVGFFDSEFDAGQHRYRLEAIYGHDMPDVMYIRCERPIIHEADRLNRVIRNERIEYVILDSIAYGTQGPPEAAEASMEYNRATRSFGIGNYNIAHITKSGEGNDQRPFGSTFWHNSARCTWNVKLDAEAETGLSLGYFCRKNNLGRLHPPVGIHVAFDGDRVSFTRGDITTMQELAAGLPLWRRIAGALKSGPLTLIEIGQEIGHDNVESIDRIVRDKKAIFTKVPGADGIRRVALVERRAS
jgi:hypothetical protein